MPVEPPFADEAVAKVFEGFPEAERATLLSLRALIFEVATETPGVGDLHETLKWGQPSYLTNETKSGTTIRLGLAKSGSTGIFTHCQTSVISDFLELAPGDIKADGNRGILFASDEMPDKALMTLLIRRALTYHQK